MHWYRIILGFIVSVVIGDLVIRPLVENYLWPQLHKHHKVELQTHTLSRQVGWLERALYTGAITIGAWEWVGVWLAIKVASRWRSTSGDPGGTPVDNIWLIGTGISIVFGFLGAWIVLGHLPYYRKP
jgi:hypothetical protein